MYPYLVADIGGTNARFAIVTGKTNHQFDLSNILILKAREFATLGDALHHYLDTCAPVQPRAMCLAIAGPVVGDRVKMTNLNWEVSCVDMARHFRLDHFVAINDFAAVAAACASVTDEHLVTLKQGLPNFNSNRAVFGAGTGLGVAGLIRANGQWLPNPSEGGHVNIAPATDFEADIIKAAMARHGHVSAENFISGPGLVNLYQAVCAVKQQQPEDITPADITRAALANSNTLAVQTLNTFCSFAGSFAGNLALTYGAQGGIYIAGGVVPRFVEFLKNSEFVERFNAKGIMSHYVEQIPVKLMIHPETAFVGAAAWLEQLLGD